MSGEDEARNQMLVCPECFGNKGLQYRIVQIRPGFDDGNCNFHPTKKGIPISEVTKIVDQVFRENYAGSPPNGYGTETGITLDELLYDLTGADDDRVVDALKEELHKQDNYWPPDGEEAFYDDGYDYHRIEANDNYGAYWERFQKILIHEQRFFSHDAFELVKQIFEGVEKQRDTAKRSPVYMIHPGRKNATFFRARIAKDHSEVRKFMEALDRELGPPPERLRTAGRLNPSGVATFYGAFELDTCIAELRPTVGCMVVSAQFKITEPICVLDTTRFAAKPKPIQIFHRDAVKRAAQWNFMQGFSSEISKPISAGNEHIDYIATQAVAEYLVNHHTVLVDGERRRIDAIIYESAQRRGGRNIAVLGAAGVVGQSPETKRTRAKSDEDDIFGILSAMYRQKTRIVPVKSSFHCYEIAGANFDKRNYFGSFGREEDEVEEEW